MKRFSIFAVAAFLLYASAAQAQVRGARLELGPAFLTKSGSIGFGTSAIESDAGVALRGRLRFGMGVLFVAGEVQTSSQDYGRPPAPGGPDALGATFVGGSVGLAPFNLVGIAPYAEVGLGRLSFKDDAISTDNGSTASTYGLGVTIGGEGRIGLDAALRLMKRDGLTASGVVGEFKYDPKIFSVMLSIRL